MLCFLYKVVFFLLRCVFFFFFNDTATTEIYTLSLHDALPISPPTGCSCGTPGSPPTASRRDRKSTRLNSSHVEISYAVFCLKKKNNSTPILTYEKNKIVCIYMSVVLITA